MSGLGRTRRRWTDGEKARLRELIARDMTHRQIGAAIGRSRTAVRQMCERFRLSAAPGLGGRPPKDRLGDPRMDALFVGAVRRGVGQSALADIFGVSEATVVRWRAAMGAVHIPVAGPATVQRRCLACMRAFDSLHVGNRICGACRSLEHRAYAVDENALAGVRVR